MADLNSVNIIGRLTRDADLKYTKSGMAVSNFSIAVNRSKKEGDKYVSEASFFDVNLFGKVAETLKQYLVKGKQVCISGELRQERWEKDGQNHSKVYIVANDIQLLGGDKAEKVDQKSKNAAEFIAGYFEGATITEQPKFNDDIPF